MNVLFDACRERPRLEQYDLLVRNGGWVALSRREAQAVDLLLERFGCVVGHERFRTTLWPDHPRSAPLLSQLMARIRRRVAPLELEIGAVRQRGYVLRDVNSSG
jgi:DNA-binding winged helix-turn-helix (wHTH) protein